MMFAAAVSLILLAVALNSQQHALAFTPSAPPQLLLPAGVPLQGRTRVHVSISSDQQRQDHIEHEGKIFSADDNQGKFLTTDTTRAALATDTINLATMYINDHDESPTKDEDAAARKDVAPIKIRRLTMNKSLAFLAGVCDVICYRRHGCYANMLTGNTIQAANALSTLRLADMAFFLSILGSYMVGFGAYRAVDRSVQEYNSNVVVEVNGNADSAENPRRRKRLVTPAVVAPVIMSLFTLYDMLVIKTGAGRWTVPILVVGSAMINSSGLESTGAVCNMMTGNFGKTANFLTDYALYKFLGGPEPSADLKRGARKSGKIIGSFFAGVALTGAMITGGEQLLAGIPFVGADAALTIASLPHFTILGAAYATLLLLYSRTVAGRAASANRPSIPQLARDVMFKLRLRRKLGHRQNNVVVAGEEAVIDPCSLDGLEADCHSSSCGL